MGLIIQALARASTTFDPQRHDINEPLQLPKQPGLLIHDSMGVETGTDDGLRMIAKFVQERTKEKEPNEQLHAIWSSPPISCYPKDF